MLSKKSLGLAVAGALVFGMSGVSYATPLIDTTGSWNGTSYILPFGETNTATYGQTFTVTGSETLLTDFTFYVDDSLNTDFVDFEAYVYAWDGSKATGSALYAGGALSTTNNGGADGFEQFTINTGGVALASGSQYVAFFSASNLFDGVLGTSHWGYLSDVYSGGSFVYMNNGSNFGSLFTNTWSSGGDSAFSMNFQPVPEPASIGLLSMGLAGLAYRRRKQA